MPKVYTAKPAYELFKSKSENDVTPTLCLRRVRQQVTNECLSQYHRPDHKLYRCGVDGDGSCFFHAMCAALDVDRWHRRSTDTRRKIGHTFRRTCAHLIKSPKFWDTWNGRHTKDNKAPSLTEIMAKFENPREWADVYLIGFVMYRFNIGCIFFDGLSKGRIYCGVKGESNAKTFVMIQWVNRSHFEPIFLHDGENMKTSLAPSDPFAKHLRSIYQTRCPV